MMRVLVACEYSGAVRDAFIRQGHDAMSCDLLPTDVPGPHYQGDVFDIIDGWEPVQFTSDCDPDGDGWCFQRDIDPCECHCIGPTEYDVEYMEKNGVLFGRRMSAPHWDLMLAFPPCTHLAVSGAKHFAAKRADGRQQQGIDFFMRMVEANIPRIVIENPIGIMSKLYRKPDQIIQPWQFGDPFQKSTCLWLKNLPMLNHTNIVDKGEFYVSPSGKKLPKWYSENKSAKNRSKTFPGIAEAMADQWGIQQLPDWLQSPELDLFGMPL